MHPQSQVLSFEVNVEPGQRLALPEKALDEVGAGRWVVTIRRSEDRQQAKADPSAEAVHGAAARDHEAFLRSYIDEDESLYDDCQAG